MRRTSDFKKTVFDICKKYNNKACNLMISGGSLLGILNNPEFKSLETSKWNIFYADERVNQKYLNSTGAIPFMSYINGTEYKIQTELGVDSAVSNYRLILEKYPIMDVCLLGMGENGHICSLWPNSSSLTVNENVIGVSVECPLSVERVTITINYINNNINELYFIIPPKNGISKKVSEPHESIKKLITKEYITYIPE